MNLEPHHEAMVLHSIRRVPDERQQDAFDLAASLLGPFLNPCEERVRSVCNTINQKFAAARRLDENCETGREHTRAVSRKRSAGSLRARSGVFFDRSEKRNEI